MIGIEVIENHLGTTVVEPFVFVPTDPVKQIQNRIFLVTRECGWKVDDGLALGPDSVGNIGDGVHCSMGHSGADGIEALRGVEGKVLRERDSV
jgi:hypothetical protein